MGHTPGFINISLANTGKPPSNGIDPMKVLVCLLALMMTYYMTFALSTVLA